MAIIMTPQEINRWNSDDQAVAQLSNAHWNAFFAEPRYGKYGVESHKHTKWREALRTLEKAVASLRDHTPAWKAVA